MAPTQSSCEVVKTADFIIVLEELVLISAAHRVIQFEK